MFCACSVSVTLVLYNAAIFGTTFVAGPVRKSRATRAFLLSLRSAHAALRRPSHQKFLTQRYDHVPTLSPRGVNSRTCSPALRSVLPATAKRSEEPNSPIAEKAAAPGSPARNASRMCDARRRTQGTRKNGLKIEPTFVGHRPLHAGDPIGSP